MQKEILDYVNSQPTEIRTIQQHAINAGFKVYNGLNDTNSNFPSWHFTEIPKLTQLCKYVGIKDIEALIRFTQENSDCEGYFRSIYKCCINCGSRSSLDISNIWQVSSAYLIELMIIKKFKNQITIDKLIEIGWTDNIAKCILEKHMDTSKIKNLKIFGLFGYLNHEISLNDGGITFIHGPNGCGKTTVLKLFDAIFSWDTSSLFEANFLSIEITNNDDTVFSVVKNFKVDVETDKHVPQLIFSLNNPKTEAFELSRDSRSNRFPVSEIESYLPFLQRVGPREWLDTNTGSRVDYHDVIDEYGDRIPHFSGGKRPVWLVSFISSINIHFIKTQRLLKIDYAVTRRGRPDDQNVTDVIQIYSNEIKEIISTKLTDQAAVSQIHDRSFPERLLSKTTDASVTEESIRQLYSDTEKRIQGLVEAGLMAQQSNISLPSKKFEETETKVLSLYLQDVNDKLNVFNELQNKIQVFLDVVGKKLRTKRLSVNRFDGFVIESLHKLGTPLHPTQLSSGEQHQIVLFYELIFKAEQNAFFLVDEPEISLHIDWQRSFLSDIHKISSLGDRNFLIATHSPQIIGSYRDLAVALEEGILNDE
ncbi:MULTISPECIES: AAA family ATPase [Methylobacter]